MQDEQTLSEVDFRAADEILARLKTVSSPEDPAHAKMKRAYASLHSAYGSDKFALREGLREPRSPHEELEVLFFSQQITREQYSKRLKAYARETCNSVLYMTASSRRENGGRESHHRPITWNVAPVADLIRIGPDSSQSRGI